MPVNNLKQPNAPERIRELNDRVAALPPGPQRDAAIQALEEAEHEVEERGLVQRQRENWDSEGGQGA